MPKSERHIITNGIILKTSISGDSNRFFKFLSPDIGIETGLAFGGERVKSRFCSSLIPFTELRLYLYKDPKTNLYSLKDISDIVSANNIRKNLNHIYFASFFADTIINTLLDFNEYKKYYALLKYSIDILNNKGDHIRAFLFFISKLIVLHGQEIQYSICKECHKTDKTLYYSPTNWGVYCKDHIKGSSINIDKNDAVLMDTFLNEKYIYLKDLDYKITNINNVTTILIDHFKKIYLDNIRTLAYIKDIF